MTNKPDEQGKGLTISGTKWFGDEFRPVTKVGVSLRQYKGIAVIDIFNKKESVAIIYALILFNLIRCC